MVQKAVEQCEQRRITQGFGTKQCVLSRRWQETKTPSRVAQLCNLGNDKRMDS